METIKLWLLKVVCGLAYTSGLVVASLGGARWVDKEFVESRAEAAPIPNSESEFNQLMKTVPQAYGISPILINAIVEQESNGKKDAIRFEPNQMARAAKITKDPQQQRMYASSHCPMQVMGWHTPSYNLSWSDLYDMQNCFEVGTSILKKCMDKHEGKEKLQQIKGALTCYNGSEKYANEVLGKISGILIEKYL